MLKDFARKYSYNLPEKLIRKVPLTTRHNAKLLVYDTQKDVIYHDTFLYLYKYLPRNSHIILNQTFVVPAKLNCVGKNGGKYELFLVLNEWDGEGDISCFTGRPLGFGEPKEVYIKKEKKVKVIIYKNKKDGITYLKNDFSNYGGVLEFLKLYGETPVPHYLTSRDKKLQEEYLRERYQTVFAKNGMSVAAPTASLHFTKEVFTKLHGRGFKESYLNLEIGRGTFAPLKESNFEEDRLHSEKYSIPTETIKILKNKKIKKVIVGTTACRTVETYGVTKKREGESEIFIHDDFKFKHTDSLVTNFHLPETSLMMLVDSFLQHKKSKRNILDLYKIAMENNYSFYSFGDSMLII
jgi:S-adenosylmethionine:tRNA ribosyltransferase-isomerase